MATQPVARVCLLFGVCPLEFLVERAALGSEEHSVEVVGRRTERAEDVETSTMLQVRHGLGASIASAAARQPLGADDEAVIRWPRKASERGATNRGLAGSRTKVSRRFRVKNMS